MDLDLQISWKHPVKLLCETESIKAEMGRYSQSDLTWMGEAAEV